MKNPNGDGNSSTIFSMRGNNYRENEKPQWGRKLAPKKKFAGALLIIEKKENPNGDGNPVSLATFSTAFKIEKKESPKGDGSVIKLIMAVAAMMYRENEKPQRGRKLVTFFVSISTHCFLHREKRKPQRGRKLDAISLFFLRWSHIEKKETPKGDGNPPTPLDGSTSYIIEKKETPKGDGNLCDRLYFVKRRGIEKKENPKGDGNFTAFESGVFIQNREKRKPQRGRKRHTILNVYRIFR